MVFGLFWLLGYQFSPRLADAGESVFWRINKTADYGAINELTRNCVNVDKIKQHWDDMMRIAGSLKLGTVHASELIRSLLKSDRPSSLAQAIIEAGRINKTFYLLNYVNDEDKARLSTFINKHVNMLGHYTFSLAEQVIQGNLRPLKQASDLE